MRSILVFLFITGAYIANSQSNILVSGFLSDDNDRPLSNVTVTLWENQDSITSVLCSTKGYYQIDAPLTTGNQYSLTFDYDPNSPDEVILFKSDETIEVETYYANVKLVKPEVSERNDAKPISFEFKETKSFNDLDIALLGRLIKMHPDICLEFKYFGSNSEKSDYYSKRKKALQAELTQSGISMNNIKIVNSSLKVRQYEDDQRAKFWITVISTEGCDI